MIAQILITSLVCFGIYKATRYRYDLINDSEHSEALGFVKKYGDQHLPIWLRKPLYDCPPCMGSFWSVMTSIYFGFGIELLMIIPAVCGMNYILIRLFPYTDD
jgi:hypothetical protein